MEPIMITKEKIVDAIKRNQTISFIYKDKKRIVEPWLIGESKKGVLQLCAYQIDGFSDSGDFSWRLYSLENMNNVIITDNKFDIKNISRLEKYNPEDSRMDQILANIPKA